MIPALRLTDTPALRARIAQMLLSRDKNEREQGTILRDALENQK